MSDLFFNSPLLRHMPRPRIRAAERTARITARLVLFLPLVFFTGIIILVVQRRLLPRRGVWAVLYWAHDYLYLPLKGYTFTQFYPYSWIWWAVAATVVALVLVSWLSDLSFIKRAHIILLRLMVPRPIFHGPLIRGVELLRRIRIRPGLMRAVATHQWEVAIIALTDFELGQAPVSVSVRVANLTHFLQKLDATEAVEEAGFWQSLLRWHQAYLALHAYTSGLDDEQRVARLMGRMLAMMPAAAVPEADLSADPFDPRRLLVDLAMLAALGEKMWAARAGMELRLTPYMELDRPSLLKELVESTEARREYFYQTYRKMEGDLRRQAGGAAFDVQRPLPALTARFTLLPLLGTVAVDVALHTALFLGSSYLAGAYLDAVDSVKLLLDVTDDEMSGHDDLRALLQGTPAREAYRLLGHLQLAELKRQQIHWEFALAQHEGILTPELFDLAQTSAAAWYGAAPTQRELEQP